MSVLYKIFQLLTYNAGTCLVLGILAFAVVGAVFCIIRARKKGKNTCMGDCSGCIQSDLCRNKSREI